LENEEAVRAALLATSGRRMEVEAPVQASQPARTHTPEGLRQRQRDRLSPRGRFAKTSQVDASGREVDGAPKNGTMTGQWSKSPGDRSPEALRKKKLQDGLRKENSVNRRAKREVEDLKYDITPDGGSAGREGRQFTVAKVGNNGRIYLR
jgi:hypothetical protein